MQFGFNRRASLFVLTAVLIGTAVSAASASARADDKSAALVLDANSGRVLFDDSASARRHPASLTKMMTLYLLFETLEAGRTTMASPIAVSRHAQSAPPSKLGLKAGTSIAVSDAIRALITKSANDVARAVAEHVGGTEANFVRLMNGRAKTMGMKDTRFTNPSGLPDRAQITTARDMITLALRLQEDFPKYYRLFNTRQFAYRGKSYRNHNRLLRTYSGVDGIKTGYIRMSGFNVVTNVRRGSQHVVAAVFGGKTAAARDARMRQILNQTLPRASKRKTWKVPRPDALIAKLKAPPQRIARNVPLPTRKPAIPAQQPSRQAFAPAPAPVETATTYDPPIEVFKVRQVAVLPSDAAENEPPVRYTADQVSDTIINSDDPIGALAALHTGDPGPAAVAAPSERGFLTPTDGRPDGGAPFSVASINETIVPKSPGPGSWPAYRRREPPAGMEQRPPSTLDAQAAELRATRNAPPVQEARYVPPAPAKYAPAPAANAGYFVQVGAYGSEADAQRALAGLQRRAGPLLSQAAPMTERVARAGKTLFRARFGGFDAAAASRTCSELRRQSVDCFVTASN